MPRFRIKTHQTREMQVVYELEAEDYEAAKDEVLSGTVDENDKLTRHIETSYFSVTGVEEIKDD